jgi:molybdate transport system substrate-binding protein
MAGAPVRFLLVAALCLLGMRTTAEARELHVLAAGSLREALSEIAASFGKVNGIAVTVAFGPSGVLRERIEGGQKADLFASADMGHPLKLLAEGRAAQVAMFVRNRLCGFARPKVGLTTADFLGRLLDPAVKLGTSTPKADPGGDYTWTMFHRADAVRPGSFAILDRKALKVVGGPANSAPIGGKDPVALAFAAGHIDVMIGYCSGRNRLLAQVPGLQVAELPQNLATGPEYGLAVLKDADPLAPMLALYMLSPAGQQVFANNGFAPVGLPAP